MGSALRQALGEQTPSGDKDVGTATFAGESALCSDTVRVCVLQAREEGDQMDAFGVRNRVIGDYESFVKSFMDIADPRVKRRVNDEISDGLLWPEPWLALNPSFQSGGTIRDLVMRGLLHPDCTDIFRRRASTDPSGTELNLHQHQSDAVIIAGRGDSYVLTTGTGSGKSLSYIVPIVDRVLRNGSGKGVQAIVVYPMNALANSQLGELEKFLGKQAPKVSYERYTGQEDRKARESILANPPDILLTNYVMLELLLTRPNERKVLIESSKNLRFLVLDELHTYRGRQGADVAMLIRRLRGAVGAGEALQCVGTSATLAGPGSKAEQRAEVAELASRLFGTRFDPNNIVGETLKRATAGDTGPDELRVRVSQAPPTSRADLETDPLAVWIEEQFGLREDEEGKLARQSPQRLETVAGRLAQTTNLPVENCAAALRATLLAGANAKDAEGRSLFAFKLHQFIGKGDTAYVTLEHPDVRYITTKYQVSAPVGDPNRPLFPLAFCRECGQDYLVVARDGKEKLVPRLLTGGAGEVNQAPGVLLLRDEPWPGEDNPDLLELLPDDWAVEYGEGRVLDKARRNRLPQAVQVDEFGMLGGGLHGLLFETLHFCPTCRTSYESTRQSEFSRLASLGTAGRAGAVTVLSQSVVRTLRAEPDVPGEARKFLAFSDNRQDASLQAGNFNDFVLVGLVRAAILRAVQEWESKGGDPLSDEDLGRAVVNSLSLTPAEFALNPDADYGAKKKIDRALRDAVAYRVYADLQRGWKITMPNLEQTGQLVIGYDSLQEIAADQGLWEHDEVNADPVFLNATSAEREHALRVLLDELRRNLCIETPYLTEERYEEIRRSSAEWLRPPWALSEERGIYSAICFPGMKRAGADRSNLYLSGLSLYGRWLRRADRFAGLRDHKLKVEQATDLIFQMCRGLAKAGLLFKVEEKNRPTGYRIQASMLQWTPGDGTKRAADPLRGNSAVGRVNPYFATFYADAARGLAGLEAREHTAQVRPDDRRDREAAFGDAKLPVLYCSPTMELGVDIKDLAVVGMRNVPPTPANYAQRSGRAGRSGQPAVVLTYCATGNAHDNFYFSRSQDMVAGAVAPPRLELGNQDLVRAHANAIWLVETGLDLKASMLDLVDVDAIGEPWFSEVEDRITNPASARRAVERIAAVLTATPEVTGAPWWREDWVMQTVADAPVAMRRALDRWRGLRRDAIAEIEGASKVLQTDNADQRSKQAAKARISEARGQLDLLKGDIDDVNQGDFYTYRYFASEGFLPGYSFPRLPLAAFIPAERKTRKGQGDYVQRPRFLAISEFGPGAFIYHEGARYEVDRVSLPAKDDGSGVNLTESKRCEACGYLNEGNGATDSEICEQCHDGPLKRIPALMKLLAVKTRRRDRISADEDERQRAGHEIVTTMRFEPHGERSSQQTSHVYAEDGTVLAELTYGDTALIRRMNVGLRRRKNKDVRGYLLNTVTGRWERSNAEQQPGANDGSAAEASTEQSESDKHPRVVPYVEDHRNALLLRLPSLLEPEQRMAVLYALKRGVEAVFQLESNELAAEPLPDRVGDHAWAFLLLFEAAEGGAGVLRRLASEHGAMQAVAREALSILHFNPQDGADLERPAHATPDAEKCAKACYDCLLSYSNQWDHQALDRHKAKDALLALAAGTLAIGGAAGEDRASQYDRLARLSNSLETQWLKECEAGGYRLPDQAQELLDDVPGVRPDFAYRRADGDCAIFIDGPVHGHAHIAQKDARAQQRLENEGWLVLRFTTDRSTWGSLMEANSRTFGAGK